MLRSIYPPDDSARRTASTFQFVQLSLLVLLLFSTRPGFSRQLVAEHRIGVRTVGGTGEFFDRQTGLKFTPRGTNYIELRPNPTNSYLVSGLFWPAYHDAGDVVYDFERMQALGYNMARVFVDLCRDMDCIANATGLRDDYMDNIVQLLQAARNHGVYVLLTANWLPDVGGYSDAHETCPPRFEGGNCLLLSQEGVVDYKKFFSDFVNALIARNAPMDAVLGYELRNEAFLENNIAPFNKTSGTVTAANGVTYDMASESDKLRLMDEGQVYWANETRATILALDPTALVTVGFFGPDFPNSTRPGDTRIVRTLAVMNNSDLDFMDYHGYAGGELTMAQLAENFGMTGNEPKPVILGEMGVFANDFPTATSGAQALNVWQADACNLGFDGYVLWYWDPEFFPIISDNVWGPYDGTGEIARVTAPVFKQDLCDDGLLDNLSLGKPTNASMSTPTDPPDRVVDGNPGVGWLSGDGPPQWIEIDLQQPETIGEIDLRVSQFPNGDTVHHIIGRASPSGPDVLLQELSGSTSDGQDLVVIPDPPWSGYRFIRVETTESPSWVAWFEISIYPPDTRDLRMLPLPPGQQSPVNGETNLSVRPNLVWDSIPLVESYEVQIAENESFSPTAYTETGIAGTSVNVPTLLDNTVYYWRIRGTNADGSGPWSATRQFTVGIISNTGTEESHVPERLAITSIYPNPFGNSTTVSFDLPENARTSVAVYDILGRRIITLLNERLSAGPHEVEWHPTNAPDGMYFARIDAGTLSSTHSIVLTK